MNLEELKRLEALATPGPWHVDDDGDTVCEVGGFSVCCPVDMDMGYAEHDAAFIAAMRNALPELIRDAERYQWLRMQHWDHVQLGAYCPSEEKLDGLIDFAISVQEKQKNG